MIASLLLSAALAAPHQFVHQGRLTEANGDPVDDNVAITFRLWDAAQAGHKVWEQTSDVEVDNGYFAVILGADPLHPLDTDLFEGQSVWLETQIGAVPMSPRQAVVDVPRAATATVAHDVRGGVVDVTNVIVNGQPVIDEDGKWLGVERECTWDAVLSVPADLLDGDDDSFATFSCVDGESPIWDGVLETWECGGIDEATVEAWVTNGALDLAPGAQMAGRALATEDSKWPTSSLYAGTAADGDVLAVVNGVPSWSSPGAGRPRAVMLRSGQGANPIIALWDDGLARLPAGDRTLPPDTRDISVGLAGECILSSGGALHCENRTGNRLTIEAYWSDWANTLFSATYLKVEQNNTEICALTTTATLQCVTGYGYTIGVPADPPLLVTRATGVSLFALAGVQGCYVIAGGGRFCWTSGIWRPPVPDDPAGTQVDSEIWNDIFVRDAVDGGSWHVDCRIDNNRQAFCWGSPQVGGPIGEDLRVFTQVVATQHFGCGLEPTGDVNCWGIGAPIVMERMRALAASDAQGELVCGIRVSDDQIQCYSDNFLVARYLQR